MRTNEKKSWQRILAFVLCMAMLLSYVPVTAFAVDGTENTVGVQVSSPAIEFVPATEPLKQEGRYLLMSVAYGHIMSFDATAAPEVASGEQHGTSYTGSIKLNESGDSENTYYMDGGKVILDNSDRHFALWNLRQYKEATGGTTRPNGSLLAASPNTTFGGSAQYAGVELQKRTNYHNSYWYSKYFDDASVAGSDFQLRYFCFKSDSTAFKKHDRNSLQTTGSRVKFILDSLGDGTFLLYFRESGSDYRVVTCYANGKWDVIRYQGSDAVSRMKADLNELKLRLYEYRETDGHKSAAFTGQMKYPVVKNTALDTILPQISSGITVFDPTHRNQHIPYNGAEVTVTNIGGTQYSVEKKAGYYWLDGSAVNTATPGEYPVLVKYRNDDGTDTTIGQVSVIVGSGYISGTTKSGFVTKNADVSTPVKVTSGAESDPATFSLNDKTVTITVGMLTDAEGNRLDTSEPGEYTGLTLTYMGMTICEDFTLTVITGDHAMNYPEYDRPGSVEVYKDSTTSEEDFAKTGVANIELSATAEPVEKGIDLIFIVDLSSSMRYHVNNSQYACGPKYLPSGERNNKKTSDYTTQKDQLTHVYQDDWWQYTRMAAMEKALADMVNTLSASNADVQIAIADFGDLDHYEFEDARLDDTIGTPAGSKPYWDANLNDTGDNLGFEFSNHVNFILGRDDTSYTGTGSYMSQPYWVDQTKHNTGYELNTNGAYRNYTGKQLPRIYTGSGKLNSDAFQNANDLNMNQIIEDMRMMNGKRLGTNYDVGLETAYRLAYAREQHNIAVGEERDLVCIFMSDGAAMQFNYLSGRSQTEAWSQCIIGETDEILEKQNVADKYVITSDPYDKSVNQNPYLQAMLKDLLDVLQKGNLIIPTEENVKSTYPKLEKHMYNGTDFFEAMKAVGVDCDWELLWQIAYELYTHHNRGLTLADGSALVYHGAVATGKNVVEAVTMSMRKPSYDASGNQYKYQTLSPYYYFYNAEGKNWWAEALKGDNHKLYPVISKFAFHDSTEWGEDVDFYYGDVRNNFSGETTQGLALDGQDYVAGFRGLDLDLYTIGFSLGTENRIAYEEAAQVLEHLASGPAYHYEAASGESLIEVLKSISSTISTSATRAFFTDKMGDDYDLSTEQYVTDAEGNQIRVNAAPTIRVVEYALDRSKPVYNTDGSLIRYERGEGTVRETITFEDLDGDGDTDAWSDQVYTIVTDGSGNQVKQYSNIWDEETGLISGKFVIYNANKYVDEHNNGSVELYLDNSGRRFVLDAETFFWTIGMIGETEMVLEYQAYLTGSVEGTLKTNGVREYYDTNESAELTYINYLGNSCTQAVESPRYPWITDFEGDLITDKYVEATDDPNEFVLTLEALAQGNIRGLTNSAGVPVVLDKTSVLREVLTDYFVLNPDDQVDVQVYTAAYNGNGAYGELVPAKGCTYALSSSEGEGGRLDTIEVTGFDYANEYISSIPRTVNGKNYFGSKLIVKVRIKTRDGFWGGNNVPTNEPTTGIYDKKRVLAVDFPEPQVNVPINVEVTAKDKTVYYGDDLDTNDNNWTGDELLKQITVGTQTGANGQIVNGSTVTVITVTNPDGSTTTTFVPEQSWMDDFATMDWADDSTTITSDLSNTNPDDYTYDIEVKPNSDGSKNNGENPGNIAGSPTDSKNDSDTGHVFVKVPQVTFKDSVTDFGAPTAGYDYAGKDLVKTEWVFMEDKNTANAPAPTTEAPELKLTYTPENGVTQFVGDTKVEVAVKREDQPKLDIQSVTEFQWQNCTHTEHGSCGKINTHKGDGQVHEFWVHTTISIKPDTVVIDFGLPVDIDPLTNDLQGVANVTRKLVGIGSDFQRSKDFTFGAARILDDNQLVRYSLHTSNGMQMDKEETFPYRGEYAINGKAVTAESTITVIPATIIYYEDSFVTYTGNGADWTAVGTLNSIQDTDRPGTGQIGKDLNNIYGYDSHYAAEDGYSMDTYHKITVSGSNYGKATFTFTGTAFDVIALSSSTTGAITVSVYPARAEQNRDNRLCNYVVDTYYGYRFVLCDITYSYEKIGEDENKEPIWKWVRRVGGASKETEARAADLNNPTPNKIVSAVEMAWVMDPDANDALYQVPVMKVDMAKHVSENNGYGTYTAVITVAYDDFLFEHGQYESGDRYDFMLDAIRIYDQANDGEGNKTIEDAYKADGEGWPTYTELRDILISANDFDSLGNGEVNGIVFIDGIPELKGGSGTGADSDVSDNVPAKTEPGIKDYANFGPNNELYLAPGQGVAFHLNTPEEVQNVHLALKSVGSTANVMVCDADAKNVNVLTGDNKAFAVNTATDLYYSISALKGKTVIIRNVSGAILSVTNIKMTYGSDPKTAELNQRDMFRVSREMASVALNALKPVVVNPFADVREDSYYYNSILWAAAKGITCGTDATHFSPDETCSRGQVVTFLWRSAGCPEPEKGTHPFVDVQPDSYYYKAVLWAVENGITAGVDESHFGPNEVCSRGQVVTFLWRAAGFQEPGVTEQPFTDVVSGSYYYKAVLWAVENGITSGVSANSFAPNLTCTRGQVVTFLYRASEK